MNQWSFPTDQYRSVENNIVPVGTRYHMVPWYVISKFKFYHVSRSVRRIACILVYIYVLIGIEYARGETDQMKTSRLGEEERPKKLTCGLPDRSSRIIHNIHINRRLVLPYAVARIFFTLLSVLFFLFFLSVHSVPGGLVGYPRGYY